MNQPQRRSPVSLVAGPILALATVVSACATAPTVASHAHSAGATVRLSSAYVVTGKASWYGRRYHGRKTASGERYDMNAMTAAHPTLAFGTRVQVTNLANGRQVALRINDRGPFVEGRIIDVSKRAARELGFLSAGVANVRIETLSD